MRGAYLRELRESRGLKASWVAARAGYEQPHFSKIEAKDSIRVDEYENIMRAMELRPGDYLENSMEEIKPLLPLVEELKRFDPAAHEKVREILRAAAAMLEDTLMAHGLRDVAHTTEREGMPYHPTPTQQDNPSVPVAWNNVKPGNSVNGPTSGEGTTAARRTTHRKGEKN